MCTLTGITNRRIGYKVLAEKDGKFYSTFTGQEIKVGEVPKAPERCSRLSTHWNFSLDYNIFETCSFYRPNFNGKTSAFILLEDAKTLRYDINRYLLSTIKMSEFEIVIVKIIFNAITFKGYYHYGDAIIASSKIKSIQKVRI